MNYAHKQWPKLTTYTEDGRLRMDNNLTENAIRPFVIGRKKSCSATALPQASSLEEIEALLPVPTDGECLENVS